MNRRSLQPMIARRDEGRFMGRLLTPGRRKLLSLLADRRPARGADLQKQMGHASRSVTHAMLQPLRTGGLVELTPAGYQLTRWTAVGERDGVYVCRPLGAVKGT